jgi:hypothetical protein
MSDECVRSITFTIPGELDGPDVQVMAVERDGNIDFTVDVLDTAAVTADLRGLFFHFDETLLDGLTVASADPLVTDYHIERNNVIDLGHGANMHGAVHEGFDVGVEFGRQGIGKDDVNGPVSFTLDGTQDLTLDAISHMLFGARLTSVGAPDGHRSDSNKLTFVAPAAPDANDDAYMIFEDGASGLDDPSTVPTPVIFDVLANDTDADGDTFSITHVFGAEHGTVEIIEGLGGASDTIRYTPDEDYAGPESFTYCIDDGNGGTDFAQVDVEIEAVADVPDLVYSISPGDSVNELRLLVTATQTDADSSEFIDRIVLSGLPAGVTAVPSAVDPAGEPDQLTQEFVLTLPLDQDTSFDLGVTAVSSEVSNGDEETASVVIPIDFEYNANFFEPTFLAADQSIWGTGEEFVFVDDRFLGFETSFDESGGGFVYGSVEGNLRAGFQSTLTFEGGDIDANLTYDITIDTNYNRTTDSLLIGSSSMLSGGGFETMGPEGSYALDFIFDYFLAASAGVDIGIDSYDLLSLQIGPSNNTVNLLDLDSDDLSIEIPLPYGLSATLEWPDVDTVGSESLPGLFTSDGASNNFLELGLDVDQALADIFLGGVNPFDVGFDIGVAWGNAELLDLDLSGGLNFLQSFAMDEQGLSGVLLFEDGSQQAFTFGSDILLQNASAIDDAGDQDGNIEFILTLDPDVQLTNDTNLGFNVGYSFDLLEISGGYDVVVDSGSFSLGPVFHAGGTLPIAAVDVYSDTFELEFDSEDLAFVA